MREDWFSKIGIHLLSFGTAIALYLYLCPKPWVTRCMFIVPAAWFLAQLIATLLELCGLKNGFLLSGARLLVVIANSILPAKDAGLKGAVAFWSGILLLWIIERICSDWANIKLMHCHSFMAFMAGAGLYALSIQALRQHQDAVAPLASGTFLMVAMFTARNYNRWIYGLAAAPGITAFILIGPHGLLYFPLLAAMLFTEWFIREEIWLSLLGGLFLALIDEPDETNLPAEFFQ